jgi:hypothetical protein
MLTMVWYSHSKLTVDCLRFVTADRKEIFLPYEINELFTYLDNGQIPPVVMEVLENTQFCHIYCGCIICEIRNYRAPYLISSDLPYDSHFLLLKPSAESQLALVNRLSISHGYTQVIRIMLAIFDLPYLLN